MTTATRGSTLVEAAVGLVLLGLVGTAVANGAVSLARVVREGRQSAGAALLGADVLHRLEAAYRRGAPACAPPAPGGVTGRAIRASWTVTGTPAAAHVEVELSWGARAASRDSIRAWISCS
jgi:hypothetical protein